MALSQTSSCCSTGLSSSFCSLAVCWRIKATKPPLSATLKSVTSANVCSWPLAKCSACNCWLVALASLLRASNNAYWPSPLKAKRSILAISWLAPVAVFTNTAFCSSASRAFLSGACSRANKDACWRNRAKLPSVFNWPLSPRSTLICWPLRKLTR